MSKAHPHNNILHQAGLLPPKKNDLFFQTKLTVNQPGDAFEQEADATADKVMRMPAAENGYSFFQPKPTIIIPVQRKCAACEEEEKLQRKEEEEETVQTKPTKQFDIQRKCAECEKGDKERVHQHSFIQTKSNGTSTGISDSISSSIQASKGRGAAMDNHIQAFMEARFGNDFSPVKIHTGSESVQMSRSLNAKAFTVGSNIHFNEGQYQPNTSSGKHLLAHELTHVIQQTGQVNRKPGDEEVYEAQVPTSDKIADVKAFYDNAKLKYTFKYYFIVKGNKLAIYDETGAHKKTYDTKRPGRIDIKQYYVGDAVTTGWGPVKKKKDESYIALARPSDFEDEIGKASEKGVVYDAIAKELFIGNWLNETQWLDFLSTFEQNMPVGMAILDIPVYKDSRVKPEEVKQGPILSTEYPDWFRELKKKVEAIIDKEKTTNKANPNLPDRMFFYGSDKVQAQKGADAWTIEVEKGKREAYLTITKAAWEAAEDKDAYAAETVQQLYRKVQLMVDEAELKKEEEKEITQIDGTAQKKGSKWAWAFKLKKQIEASLAIKKANEKEAKDFPDNLSLSVQSDKIHLRVWVYKDGTDVKPGDLPELFGGTLPISMKETDKAEDWVPIVRKAAAAIRSGNVTTDPNAVSSDKGAPGGDATVLPPYPATIHPKDMNPDLSTATIASNNFRMVIDTASVHGNNLLNLATIHMGFSTSFSWNIYPLPEELKQVKANPQASQEQLVQSTNEYASKNGASLGEPKKTYSADFDWEQKVKMKDIGEGDFMLTSKAAISYPADWNMRRQASVAGLPLFVKTAEDMAKQLAMADVNTIEQLKKNAEKETDPGKKKLMLEQVKELEAREKTDLLTLTKRDAEQTEKLIKKAGELKKFIQDDRTRKIAFSGDKANDPFMLRLKAFDKDLYSLYILVRQIYDYRYDDITAIDEYTKIVTQQASELRKLEKRNNRMIDNEKLRKDMPVQRCVAALVKEDDGNVVPLIVLVGHHIDSDPAKGKYKMMVLDVTFDSQKKDMTYAGGEEANEKDAIHSAFVEFGDENKYGDGKIVYRVAGTSYRGQVDSDTTTLEYLGYALAAIGIALLIAGTVLSAGALAPASAAAIGTVVTYLGISTAVVGAALAARNIYKRVEKGTFELDAEFAIDIVSIIGAFVQVVGTAGRAVINMSRTLGAAQRLLTIQRLDKLVLIYDSVELAGNAILIGLKVHDDIAAVKELGLPKEQEDEMMQQIAMEAIQQGAMIAFASVGKIKDLKEHISAKIENSRYKSFREKGWVNESNQPTDQAPPFLKNHVPEPGKPPTKAQQGEQARKESAVFGLGDAKTKDTEHNLTVTERGRIIRCSDFCTDLRMKYNEVLEKDPFINKEMTELEIKAQKAAKSGNKEEAKKVAAEASNFEAKLKEADDLRKHLFGMTDQEISDAIDAADAGKVTGGAKSGHKIDDTRIPKRQRRQVDVTDIMTEAEFKELGKGGYKKAMERINVVMGKKISDIPELKAHWDAARKDVLKGKEPTEYSRETVIGMYKEAQRKFWANVRKDGAAVDFLKKQGFEFEGDSGAAMAVLGPQGKKATERGTVTNQERRISLDHIDEKAQGENWKRALDGGNLELMFQNANSWKEIVQVKFGMRSGE